MRAEASGAIDALLDTVKSIKAELEEIRTAKDLGTINRLEERIRHECQVIEAMPGYMGQEIYRQVQIRRAQLRAQNYNMAVNAVKEVMNGDSGTNGDTGGSDKSGGAKQEGDTKTKRPSRQSKPKK